MKRRETPDDIRPDDGANGAARAAELVGYRREWGGQLTFPDGSEVSSLLDLLDDNPGAVEALLDWIRDNLEEREAEEENDG